MAMQLAVAHEALADILHTEAFDVTLDIWLGSYTAEIHHGKRVPSGHC